MHHCWIMSWLCAPWSNCIHSQPFNFFLLNFEPRTCMADDVSAPAEMYHFCCVSCNGTCLSSDQNARDHHEMCNMTVTRQCCAKWHQTSTWILSFKRRNSMMSRVTHALTAQGLFTSQFAACAVRRLADRLSWSVWRQHIFCIFWNQEKEIPKPSHSHQRFWLHS